MSLKKINTILAVVLLLITSMVLFKLLNPSSTRESDLSLDLATDLPGDPSVPSPGQPSFAPAYTEEQVKTRYEELKVERLISAMKSHHTRDVMLIIADGINFDLISSDHYDKVRLIAQEENYLHIIKPILRD